MGHRFERPTQGNRILNAGAPLVNRANVAEKLTSLGSLRQLKGRNDAQDATSAVCLTPKIENQTRLNLAAAR